MATVLASIAVMPRASEEEIEAVFLEYGTLVAHDGELWSVRVDSKSSGKGTLSKL